MTFKKKAAAAALLILPMSLLSAAGEAFASPAASSSTYTVQAGDTLSGIALHYGTTYPALAEANHLANPNLILVGEVLTVSGPALAAVPAEETPAPVVSHTTSAPTVVHESSAPVKRSAPAPTVSTYSPSSSFEQCVISRESGGNSQVVNGSGHWGLYQFSYSTWVANGGSPSSFGHASAAEQHSVFVHSSPSNWQPYDHC